MVIASRARHVVRVGALAFVLGLVVVPSAFAGVADTVNLTRFSKAVDGTISGGPSGSVTVNLLRNTIDVNGVTVRQQVDSFTTSVTGGTWSGAFANHAFSAFGDQVEVNYTGIAGQERVTIGGGNFLASAVAPGAHVVGARADAIDGRLAIANDGSTMKVGCCISATAKVNGTPQPAPVSGVITFLSPVTDTDTVLVTGKVTGGVLPNQTTVNLTDGAPLRSALPADHTSPFTGNLVREPDCDFYMVTHEAVCHQLTPGSYTLTQLRSGSPVASQTLTVPARAATSFLIPSQAASSPLANVAAGDQLRLALGARVLTTLTVGPFTINRSNQFGDLDNGSNTTTTGTCSSQLFFNTGDLCVNGMVPGANNLRNVSVSLSSSNNLVGGGEVLGQLSDTSAGATEIDMPRVAYSSPLDRETVHTPFIALALARYNDPAVLVAFDNNRPGFGPPPTLTSTPSAAPVSLSIARLGSSSFRFVGNANRAGGLVIPALAPGVYVDRFSLTDSRGDVNSFEGSFVVVPGPPPGPAVRCKVKSSGGLRASITAKGKGRKKHKPKKSTTITLTLTCSSTDSAARVAVWLERGTKVLADGSGLVKRGAARITLSGKFQRGKYRLVELVDSRGVATETTGTLTLRK